MRAGKLLAVGAVVLLTGISQAADLKDAPAKEGFPKFKVEEFATDLKIGYAVTVADVNGDKKPDIVVVDQHRVVWYENPTWKVRTILQGKTKPDNVCIAAADIDGGGDVEFAIGAGWKPSDTQTPGTLQWLKRGKTLDEEWTLHPIPCDEPTVHRIRFADLDGDGKPELISAPLQGRGASAKGNYTDGRPVRITAYKLPGDPTKPANWKPEVLSEELHVVHNIDPLPREVSKGTDLLAVAYEGVFEITRDAQGKWTTKKVGAGNQVNPKGSRGASEVRQTLLKGRAFSQPVIATVEPWHGNQIVTYTTSSRGAVSGKLDRHVIDEQLRWGHALAFADLDGTGSGWLVAGVRDDPNAKDAFKERRGVRIYKCLDGRGATWSRHIIEDGGVAVEDLTAADLDGDGKPDIVAVGRQTGNGRIYWNKGR